MAWKPSRTFLFVASRTSNGGTICPAAMGSILIDPEVSLSMRSERICRWSCRVMLAGHVDCTFSVLVWALALRLQAAANAIATTAAILGLLIATPPRWHKAKLRYARLSPGVNSASPPQRLHDLLARERGLRIPLEDDLAAVDGVEPVGDPRGGREVRLGDQQRHAHAFDLPHRLDEAVHHHRREPLERLVEEQDRGDERERPGDRDHLLLTAAQVQAPAAEECPDLGEELEDARLD